MEKYSECSCDCFKCKSMCLTYPCFPTPQDVDKLIRAGYENDLMQTTYIDLEGIGLYNVIAPKSISVQIPDKNGEPLILNKCTFLDEYGLCKLHKSGLKPTEGKIANHDRVHQDTVKLRIEVCNTWTDENNSELVSKIKNYLDF